MVDHTTQSTCPAPNGGSKASAKKPKCKKLKFTVPTTFVTLLACDDGKETKFVVHKELACCYSPVLKAAFESNLIEGQTQVYKLTDHPESVVKLLVQWLYHQDIEIEMSRTQKSDKKESMNLTKLWVLSDYLLILELRSFVAGKLWATQRQCKDTFTNCINYAYENTCERSTLRTLFILSCTAFLDLGWIATNLHAFPKELLIDMVVLYKNTNEPTEDMFTKIGLGVLDTQSGYKLPEQQICGGNRL